MSEVIDILDRKTTLQYISHLFDLPDDIALAPYVHQHSPIAKGAHLYYQGDKAGDVFILLDGTMKAYQVTHDGEESIVRFIFPGEVLWTSGFHLHARSTSVVALDRSHVVSMPDGFLQKLMSDNDGVQQRCFRMLSKIIKDEQAFIHLLATGNADRRVAYMLMHIWKHQAPSTHSPFRINIPMTRSDIGRYLGLSEETVSRVFSRFQASGMIKIAHPQVELLDPHRMETLSQGELPSLATG